MRRTFIYTSQKLNRALLLLNISNISCGFTLSPGATNSHVKSAIFMRAVALD